MKRALVLALAFACGLATAHAARAQTAADDYPQRTVTFLCLFPAGGGTDMLTRILAQELQDKLKRPVIVDNRPGAGTIVAASSSRASVSPTSRSWSSHAEPLLCVLPFIEPRQQHDLKGIRR